MKTKKVLKLRKDTQTFEELFVSISKLSTHVVNDNKLSIEADAEFPMDIRYNQIQSLSVLVKTLKETYIVALYAEDSENELD